MAERKPVCPDCGNEIDILEGNMCRFCGYLYLLSDNIRERTADFAKYKVLKELLTGRPQKSVFKSPANEIGFIADIVTEERFDSEILDIGMEFSFTELLSVLEDTGCLVFSNILKDETIHYYPEFLKMTSEKLEKYAAVLYPEFVGALKTPQYADWVFTDGFLRANDDSPFFEKTFEIVCSFINLISKKIRIVIALNDVSGMTGASFNVLQKLLTLCPENLKIIASDLNLHGRKYKKKPPFETLKLFTEGKAELLDTDQYANAEFTVTKFITEAFSGGGGIELIKQLAAQSLKDGEYSFIKILAKIPPKSIVRQSEYLYMIHSILSKIQDGSRHSETELCLQEYAVKYSYCFCDKRETKKHLAQLAEMYSETCRNAADAEKIKIGVRGLFHDIFKSVFTGRIIYFEKLYEDCASFSEHDKECSAFKSAVREGLSVYPEIYEAQKEYRGRPLSVKAFKVLLKYLEMIAEYAQKIDCPKIKSKALYLAAKYKKDLAKGLECLRISGKSPNSTDAEHLILTAKACNLVINECLAADSIEDYKDTVEIALKSIDEVAVKLLRLFPRKSIFDETGGMFYISSFQNKRGFYYYRTGKNDLAREALKRCRAQLAFFQKKEYSCEATPNYQTVYECSLVSAILKLGAKDYKGCESDLEELELFIKNTGFNYEQSIIWLGNTYIYFRKLYEQFEGNKPHEFYKYKEFKITRFITATIRYALINTRLVLFYGHSELAVSTYELLKRISEYFKNIREDYYNNYKNISLGFLSICLDSKHLRRNLPVASALEERLKEDGETDFEFFINKECVPFDETDMPALMNHLIYEPEERI